MRVLGFDPGHKKIGVAVGNLITQRAEPILTWRIPYAQWGSEAFAQQIHYWCDEWRPQQIIVGYATTADGQKSPQQARSERFVGVLAELVSIPCQLVDERLSSHEASARMADLPRHQQALGLDAVAAAVIIESYLAEMGRAG